MKKWVIFLILLIFASLIIWAYFKITLEKPSKEKITSPEKKLKNENKSNQAPINQSVNKTNKITKKTKIKLKFIEDPDYGTKFIEEGSIIKNETIFFKLKLGESISEVIGKRLFEEDFPLYLKKRFIRDEEGEKIYYTPRLTLSENFILSNFTDKRKDPDNENFSIGINLSSKEELLTYSIFFNKKVKKENLVGSIIRIFGKDYYFADYDREEDSFVLLESPYRITSTPKNSFEIYYPGFEKFNLFILGIFENKTLIKINNEPVQTLHSKESHNFNGAGVGIESIDSSKNKENLSLFISPIKVIFSQAKALKVNKKELDEILVFFFPEDSNYLNRIDVVWKTSEKKYILPKENLQLDYFKNINISVSEYYEDDETSEVFSNVSIISYMKRLIEEKPKLDK